MNPRKLLTAVSTALLLVSSVAQSHEDEGKGQVGRFIVLMIFSSAVCCYLLPATVASVRYRASGQT